MKRFEPLAWDGESGWLARFSKLIRQSASRAKPRKLTAADERLLAAAADGDALRALLALREGASPGAVDEQGFTALGLAARWGKTDCVRALRPLSDPSVGNAPSGKSALLVAAANGRADCVEELLPHSDPAATDNYGFTALMLAAGVRNPAALALLLPYGGLEAKNRAGQTALTRAAREGHDECVRALLEAGANPRRRCDEGWTALMDAVMGGSKECVAALLPVSDAGARSQDGKSAADLARSVDVQDIAMADEIDRVALAQRERRELEAVSSAPASSKPTARL